MEERDESGQNGDKEARINKAAFPANPSRRLPGVRRSLLAKESGPIAADLSFERLFLLFPATSESGQVLESELFQAFP